jgi:hypothetical protein
MPTSPLARDNTAVVPLRLKKKDSFSTAHHTHGLGGEAKDAMLRPGLRMRRTTSSLRIIATKGNATLTAAFTHKVFVPELEIFLKNYARKEDEFAESIPSAMCPFQFIQNDTSDIVPFQRRNSSNDVKAETDPQQLREWLKEMRLKVHMRLVQRQQVTNMTNPTEGHKLTDKTHVASTATPTKGGDSERKKATGHDSERKKGTDTERKRSESERKKGTESDRKKGSDTDRKKQESDRKKKGDMYDAIEEAVPLPRSSTETRISSGQSTAGETSSGSSSLKSPKQQKDFPPPSRKPLSRSSKAPQANKSAAQGAGPLDGNTPLFQARKNPTLTRRTHSEYDVRRVRIKARNSVGFEPAW